MLPAGLIKKKPCGRTDLKDIYFLPSLATSFPGLGASFSESS